MPIARKFDLIIFDLDGTLIDNRYAIRENFNFALKEKGFDPVKNEEIDSMIGTDITLMFEKVIPPEKKFEAKELTNIYRTRYIDTSHIGTVVFAGVIQTLRLLRRQGFKLAIATTKGDKTVPPLLERIGILRYFDLVVGSTPTRRPKPYPDMIYYVMEQLGFDKKRSVMVGDTPTDVLAARNAGIPCIAVKTGARLGIANLEDLKRSNPYNLVDDVAGIEKQVLVWKK